MHIRHHALLTTSLLLGLAGSAAAQTRAAPSVDPAGTVGGPRPLPGPVYETPEFTRAVSRGSRTRTGAPSASNWVQHARYRIEARLDVATSRVSATESVVYLNRSPDTLRDVMVHLRQNLFAPGSARLQPVPITGGVTLTRVALAGRVLDTLARTRGRGRRAAVPAAGYTVNGTVMRIRLAEPLPPGDSLRLEFAWSFAPPPSPSDGRQGREDHLYFIGYWYPQIAVYDDVNGWVADPYMNGAEFYMDPADYDVRLTVPRGWVVGATGTLHDSASVLSRRTLDRLRSARQSRDVMHVIAADDRGQGGGFAAGGKTTVWHFTADSVRDFAWGTSDRYAWDATIAILRNSVRARSDTVMIHSYFRLDSAAGAWALGGARYTRDAIEQMSSWLWPYPWPQMSSFEGVLTSGGMEYPMATVMQPWADTLSLAGDLMHETGHMWFPMQVGSNETRHPWMDEGLTQFDVAQGMRVLYGAPRTGGRPNDSEEGQRGRYLSTVREGLDQSLMQWGDLFPQPLYSMYYDKTSQALAALRGVIGTDAVQRGLREYGRRWAGRHPEPEDFFNTFDAVAGRDLAWFWGTWFYQPWPLDQAIGEVRFDGDSVRITIEDRGMAPMPVRLAITRGTSVERVEVPVTVWLGGARRAVVSIAAAPGVSMIEIDPEQVFPDADRSNNSWVRRPK